MQNENLSSSESHSGTLLMWYPLLFDMVDSIKLCNPFCINKNGINDRNCRFNIRLQDFSFFKLYRSLYSIIESILLPLTLVCFFYLVTQYVEQQGRGSRRGLVGNDVASYLIILKARESGKQKRSRSPYLYF